MSAPVVLMTAGGALAAWGFARRHLATRRARRLAALGAGRAGPRRHHDPAAVGRLVWDVLAALAHVVVFAFFAFGPKYTIAPRQIPRVRTPRVVSPLTFEQARRKVGGR